MTQKGGKVKKKWFCGAAAAALAGLLLAGCAMPQTSIDSLLAPPRLNDEQNEIYSALVRETSTDIRLLYPQKGTNRSAFLITNLDGEATAEALVFYQSTSAANVSAAVHLNVLDKQEDRWVSVNDISLDGSQVEDVTLMNVGTGVPMVAVGLNYASDGASLLKIFSFNGKTLDEICSESYQTKIVYDMDSDDQDEVILVSLQEGGLSMEAKFFTYENGRFRQTSTAIMDPSITRYVRIQAGYLKNGRKAVYLDGYRGSSLMTTEILGYEKSLQGGSGYLVNLTYDPAAEPKHYPVDRPPGAYTYDTNNDSVMEVPGLTLMPGYTEEMTSVFYLTDWYNFLDGEFQKLKSSYVNSSQGYLLDFPAEWIGRVSVRKTSRANEMLFYEYQEGEEPIKSELLYIQMSKRSDWEAGKLDEDYQVINSSGGGQIVYLAKIPDNAPYDLRLTLQKVKERFHRYY